MTRHVPILVWALKDDERENTASGQSIPPSSPGVGDERAGGGLERANQYPQGSAFRGELLRIGLSRQAAPCSHPLPWEVEMPYSWTGPWGCAAFLPPHPGDRHDHPQHNVSSSSRGRRRCVA